MERIELSGVVLSGGAGRRAGGRDKGLLACRGRALVEHAIAALAPQVGALALSVNRNHARYAGFGLPLLDDPPPPFRGPLAGLVAALAWCPGQWLATAPVDVPEPPSDWVAALARCRSDARIRVLHDGVRRQVLFALYPRALAAAAAAALARGELAVHRFQDAHGAVEVRQVPARPIANLNTIA